MDGCDSSLNADEGKGWMEETLQRDSSNDYKSSLHYGGSRTLKVQDPPVAHPGGRLDHLPPRTRRPGGWMNDGFYFTVTRLILASGLQKNKFLRSSVGESVSEKNSWLSSPKRIHPSFASPSTRPLFPRSRSFVARNENKRDVLFSFHLFVSCRASWIGRARETRRGSVRARHLVGRNFLHLNQRRRTPADVAARTTRSRNERRSERTQHYFLLHPRPSRFE